MTRMLPAGGRSQSRRRLPRRRWHRRGPPQRAVPQLRAPAARCAAGPGDVAPRRAKDDQTPRPEDRAAGRDLAPAASTAPESPSIFETVTTSRWSPGSWGTSRPAPRSSTIHCRRRSRSTRSSASTSEWLGDGHCRRHFARPQPPTREPMNKSELSSRVASDASLSRLTADSVVDAVLSTIADTLARARVSRSPDSGCSP